MFEYLGIYSNINKYRSSSSMSSERKVIKLPKFDIYKMYEFIKSFKLRDDEKKSTKHFPYSPEFTEKKSGDINLRKTCKTLRNGADTASISLGSRAKTLENVKYYIEQVECEIARMRNNINLDLVVDDTENKQWDNFTKVIKLRLLPLEPAIVISKKSGEGTNKEFNIKWATCVYFTEESNGNNSIFWGDDDPVYSCFTNYTKDHHNLILNYNKNPETIYFEDLPQGVELTKQNILALDKLKSKILKIAYQLSNMYLHGINDTIYIRWSKELLGEFVCRQIKLSEITEELIRKLDEDKIPERLREQLINMHDRYRLEIKSSIPWVCPDCNERFHELEVLCRVCKFYRYCSKKCRKRDTKRHQNSCYTSRTNQNRLSAIKIDGELILRDDNGFFKIQSESRIKS